MKENYKTIAIIMAAGIGSRINISLPKQYVKLAGETVLSRVIRKFTTHPLVDEVVIVINKDHLDYYKDISTHPYVIGGKRRQDSVRNALEAISEYNPEKVLIQDAARVFTDADTISKIIHKLDSENAVIAAAKLNDTLKHAKDSVISKTVCRENLFLAQTPQGFRYNFIRELHNKYKELDFTDDSSLCEHAGEKVEIVESNTSNFKITTVSDLELAEAILKARHIDHSCVNRNLEKTKAV